jgi:hypothetical protein
MNDENKMLRTVWACLSILMIVVCVTAANTPTKTAAQLSAPNTGSLAQPRPPEQIGLPLDQTKAAIPPDNPQNPRENCSRSETILRRSSVSRWNGFVRHLPQSGTRIHPWQAYFYWHPRPHGPKKRAYCS